MNVLLSITKKKERKIKMVKTEKQRYIEFQRALDYFFDDVAGVNDEDYFKFSEVKTGIIFFMCKNKFHENGTCFLGCCKRQIYENLNKLVVKHRDLRKNAKILAEFMEDFYPDIKIDYDKLWNDNILLLDEMEEEK
jgi:hypothetical protein